MVIQITWTQGMLKIKYALLLIEIRQLAVRQQTRNRSKKVPYPEASIKPNYNKVGTATTSDSGAIFLHRS